MKQTKRILEVLLGVLIFALQIYLEANRNEVISQVKTSIIGNFWITKFEIGQQPIFVLALYSSIYFGVFVTIVYLFTKNKKFTSLLAGIDLGLLLVSFLLFILKKSIFQNIDILPEELSLLLYRLTNSPLLYILVLPTYFLYIPKGEEQ